MSTVKANVSKEMQTLVEMAKGAEVQVEHAQKKLKQAFPRQRQ